MTKAKDRVDIYKVVIDGYQGHRTYSLVKGSAIETREMFINIEPAECRNAFFRSRVDKADWMRTAKGAIWNEIRRHQSDVIRYEKWLSEVRTDLETLINLDALHHNIDD